MIPATPTPLGPGTALLSIPQSYSLWGGVSSGVQAWHLMGQTGEMLQLLALVVLVAAAAYVLVRSLRQMTRKDSEE